MPEDTYLVTRYGALGGETLDTSAIQRAIDAAASHGGGVVHIPAGVYRSGTLFLKSGVVLHLRKGATLLGSDRLEDYPAEVACFVDAVGQPRGRCLILAHKAEKVGLEGSGTIDGNGAAFSDPQRYNGRPFLVRFVNCADVLVKDVTMRDSAAWVSHYECCDSVRIENVTIHSWVNHNNDGMDIDSCSDVRIENCDVNTGDDAICLKATTPKPCTDVFVRNCRLTSGCGAIKLGTESYGDFRRIRISNCQISDTGLCGIKVITMDGGVIEDVQITDITMVRTTGPIFVRLGDRGRVYGDGTGARRPPGRIRGLTLQNITAEVVVPLTATRVHSTSIDQPPKAFSGMTMTGIPGHPIENLRLDNLKIDFVGGGAAADAAAMPTEQTSNYPEHFYFGVLPAWAMFLRHAIGVNLSNIRISARYDDERPSLVCDDVTGLEITGWEDGSAVGTQSIRYRS